MQYRRIAVIAGLMLVALFALTGCGPRAGAQTQAAADPSALVVDLPAIYVDFGNDGVGRIGNMSVSQAGALIGQSLPDLTVDPALLKTLGDYDIQTVQLVNTPKGLDVLVNGLRVPSLAWDGQILGNLRTLFEGLGLPLGQAGNVLPLLGTLSSGVVIRFPVASGAEALPLVDPEAAATAQRAQEAIANAGEAIANVQFTVQYADDGTWTVDGRGEEEWEQVVPVQLDDFTLSPERLASITGAGIHQLGVATDPEGIKLSLNGNALPTITWGSGEINNILKLLEQSGVLDELTGGSQGLAGVVPMIEGMLPTVQTARFNMTVNFPSE